MIKWSYDLVLKHYNNNNNQTLVSKFKDSILNHGHYRPNQANSKTEDK